MSDEVLTDAVTEFLSKVGEAAWKLGGRIASNVIIHGVMVVIEQRMWFLALIVGGLFAIGGYFIAYRCMRYAADCCIVSVGILAAIGCLLVGTILSYYMLCQLIPSQCFGNYMNILNAVLNRNSGHSAGGGGISPIDPFAPAKRD